MVAGRALLGSLFRASLALCFVALLGGGLALLAKLRGWREVAYAPAIAGGYLCLLVLLWFARA